MEPAIPVEPYAQLEFLSVAAMRDAPRDIRTPLILKARLACRYETR
jgi:hypothetical protein